MGDKKTHAQALQKGTEAPWPKTLNISIVIQTVNKNLNEWIEGERAKKKWIRATTLHIFLLNSNSKIFVIISLAWIQALVNQGLRLQSSKKKSKKKVQKEMRWFQENFAFCH